MKAQCILLVDDDEDDQLLFLDAMREIDKSIICCVANDGLEAILSLHTKSPVPDLIFLDLNMPKMNGYQCLAQIKKEMMFKEIPVVIYTTSRIESDRDRTLKMGASYFLTKPSDFSELIEELTRILKLELKDR
jgi:CheY-like chemotaxis protein